MKKLVFFCLISAVLGAALTRLFLLATSGTLNVEGSPDPLATGIDELATRPVIELAAGSTDSLPHDDDVVFAADDRADLAGLSPEERINVIVYERVNRAVVNINTRSVRTDPFMMFESPSEGAGSGSVLDRQGHILTNYHVVEGAREIQVTLANGIAYDAHPVGMDPATDMAVIKIDAPPESLFPVALGESTRLKVGQRVLAIGNPFGLERTLTVGIVSSLNRTIRSSNQRKIQGIIQTDAAINPGNSGGPLLDSHGRLIGVNTAIASRTGQSAGVGFAIPVSAVRYVVPQLIRDGRVIRAEIGIAKVVETEQGLVIATTTKGGPAESAGLQGFRLVTRRRRQGPFVYEQTSIDRSAADRIVAVDGVAITSADQFLHLIESHKPGETITVTVIREGTQVDVPVALTASE